MFEVEVKQVPAQRYSSRTANVLVAELSPFIVESIQQLGESGRDGPPFAVYHGQVNEIDDGPVEVGVPQSGGDRELPGGEVAYTTVAGDDCEFPQILGAYDAIVGWAKEHERDFAGPPREVYLSGGPDEPQPRWEVVWPLL
jgi:effector-binding domain-containing protein